MSNLELVRRPTAQLEEIAVTARGLGPGAPEHIMLYEPMLCACGKFTTLHINRWGETRCYCCDWQTLKAFLAVE